MSGPIAVWGHGAEPSIQGGRHQLNSMRHDNGESHGSESSKLLDSDLTEGHGNRQAALDRKSMALSHAAADETVVELVCMAGSSAR
jgi:hypothetical protein